jgi:hypothetical protein
MSLETAAIRSGISARRGTAAIMMASAEFAAVEVVAESATGSRRAA